MSHQTLSPTDTDACVYTIAYSWVVAYSRVVVTAAGMYTAIDRVPLMQLRDGMADTELF